MRLVLKPTSGIVVRATVNVPASVPGIEVGVGATVEVVAELRRGLALGVRLLDAEGNPGVPDDHLFFLFEEGRRDAVSGPYAKADGAHNMTLNGLPIWIESHELVDRGLHPDGTGEDWVNALEPGRHSVVALPDDLVLEPAVFDALIQSIREPADLWMTAADFRSFIDAQELAAQAYQDQDRWTRISILNTAASGRFSTDRTMQDYNAEIWKVDPIKLDAK